MMKRFLFVFVFWLVGSFCFGGASPYKHESVKSLKVTGDWTTQTVTLQNTVGGLIVYKGDSAVTATADLQVSDEVIADLELATGNGGTGLIDFSTPISTSATIQLDSSVSSPSAGLEFVTRMAAGTRRFKMGYDYLTVGNWKAPTTTGTLNQALRLGSDLETLEWFTVSSGSGDVTAGSNLGDNLLIRGDGAGKGVQNSGITVGDSDDVTGVNSITVDQGATFNNSESAGGDLTWKDENGATGLLLDADGNVEVGIPLLATNQVDINTASDVQMLQITGHSTQTNDLITAEQNGGTDIFRVTNTSTLIPLADSLTVDGEIDAEDSGGIGLVDDAGNLGVWVEDGGQVGVGTKTPSAELHIDKSSGIPVFRIESGNNYVVLNLVDGIAGGTSSGYGIYNGFPAAGDFTVRENGVANHLIIKKTTGSVLFPGVYDETVTSARDLEIQSDGKIGYVTSRRDHKTNIRELTTDTTKIIYDFLPKIYDRVDGSNDGEIGLIAEEVEAIAKNIHPDLISYRSYWTTKTMTLDDGTTDVVNDRLVVTDEVQTVNYSRLIVPMLRELQAQKERNDSQDRMIKNQAARIEKLEKKTIRLR